MTGPKLFFGSGQYLDAYNFTREQLCPRLLGRSLSRINRYSGNGDRSVSVAQHSWQLSYQVGENRDDQRAALMHDVPEIFTGDVPTPIKRLCPELEVIDARIIRRIHKVFEIPMEAFVRIHEIDGRISKDEALFMFDALDPEAYSRVMSGGGPLGIHIHDLPAGMAAEWWTHRFQELFQ